LLDELSRVPLPRLVRILAMVEEGELPFEPDIVLELPASANEESDRLLIRAIASKLVDDVRAELAMKC
jgi:hypothetical protein